MAKKPKTTSEHLIAMYGYITGLKREINIFRDLSKGETIKINKKINNFFHDIYLNMENL